MELWLPLAPVVGEVGTPVGDHAVVGVSVSGVLFVSSPLVETFDSCDGHVFLKDRSYHYHLEPTCLLDSLSRRMDLGLEEVLVGYALDGFGIHARRDPTSGTLTTPALDECNGAYVDGSYRYYISPARPYVPDCLKGTAVSDAPRTILSPLVACPKRGRNNTYVRNASLTVSPVRCDTPSPSKKKRPMFTFRADPRGGGSWRAHSRGFSVAFAVAAVGTVLAIARMRYERLWPGVTTYAGGQVVLALFVCVLRSASLSHDPYWAKRSVDALAYGASWGVCYPFMDVMLLLELWHACEIVAAVRPQAFRRVPAKVVVIFGASSRWSAVGDFGVQFMADYFRSRGQPWDWLKVCQIYYVVLGALTCAALVFVVAALQGGSRDLRRHEAMNVFLFRLTCKLVVIAAFGAALCVTSAFHLAKDFDMSADVYFLVTSQQRLFEVCLCVVVVYAALPAHWSPYVTATDVRDRDGGPREIHHSFTPNTVATLTVRASAGDEDLGALESGPAEPTGVLLKGVELDANAAAAAADDDD